MGHMTAPGRSVDVAQGLQELKSRIKLFKELCGTFKGFVTTCVSPGVLMGNMSSSLQNLETISPTEPKPNWEK